MSDAITDVLLVTADRDFVDLVARHRPPAAQFRVVSPEGTGDIGPFQARQIWVDLDSVRAPLIPAAARRVYFYSSGRHPGSEALPAGLFIRKPCAPVVFELLWADIPLRAAERPLPPSANPNHDVLPRWILDFHELQLAPLCRKMMTGLAPRLGYRHVSLYLHDFESGRLALADTTHPRPIDQTLPMDAAGQHLMVDVARSRQVFQSEHTADELAARGISPPKDRAYEDEACLVAPLCNDGLVWGVLNFSEQAQTALTEDDLPLEDIFVFLGRALHHARAYEQARTEARVDNLTGLYNLRWINESLEREIRRADRFGTSLAVLMIDLDDLKAVNDRRGHAAGDCVLRHVAAQVKGVLRQFDGAARVGGDEFVIMLPATDAKGALHVARRLLDSIRRGAARYRGETLPIRASIGAAEWKPGWNASGLLDAADQAMYRAKQDGRDRVVCAGGEQTETRAAAGTRSHGTTTSRASTRS